MTKNLHVALAALSAISIFGAGCGSSYNGAPTGNTNQVPAITSAANANFTTGTAGSFAVTATGTPAPTLSESGALPGGVTFTSAGLLSGTSATGSAGTYPLTITAQNGIGTNATQAFTLTVASGQVVTPAAAVRFLEQSTFGPTPAMVSQVQQTGFTPFLNDQFSQPMSTYPDPASTVTDLTPTQQIFFENALTGSDQLRQRVAFALSEIWVTSGNTIPPQGMAPYMRLLSQDAFANYRTIMQDITLSPAMGNYLNMVNNDKPNTAANTHANQNYARELMQLFTIGLDLLNQDGSLQLDTSGNPIPSYTENNVDAFSRAYTGWTYPTQPGSTLQKHNPTYWIGPMEALDSNHDMTAKTLLRGTVLPAGQTSAQDLAGALDNIFNHPNVAPFICKQLIQHLVTSNPSAAYVKRVADVFASGTFAGFGSGQRGDMKAVIASILLDSEARRGDVVSTTVATDGHLREPILYIANLLRAFGAVSDGAGPVNFANSLSEPPLRAPSVFNFFPPDYQIPGTTSLGPEFNLQTTATSLARINFANSFVFGSIGSGTTVDFTPYATVAGSGASQLVTTLNTLLMHGSLSSSANASIVAAVNAVPAGSTQTLTQAKTAIYLITSSSQYQIEH